MQEETQCVQRTPLIPATFRPPEPARTGPETRGPSRHSCANMRRSLLRDISRYMLRLYGFDWDDCVAIDLKALEQLATDHPALKAGAGLAKPAKWSGVGASRDGALLWGECAGSGANPYRVMAD